MTTRAVSKASRLLLLHLLREAGVIGDEATQSDIARWLGVNRSTVHKDLRAIDAAIALYRELEASQPWVRRYYSTSETAVELGLDHRTALAMIAGGVIHGEQTTDRGSWRVPVAEVDRWRAILAKR